MHSGNKWLPKWHSASPPCLKTRKLHSSSPRHTSALCGASVSPGPRVPPSHPLVTVRRRRLIYRRQKLCMAKITTAVSDGVRVSICAANPDGGDSCSPPQNTSWEPREEENFANLILRTHYTSPFFSLTFHSHRCKKIKKNSRSHDGFAK